MAGFTNYAYRRILRRFGGVGLPATEMVSARGVLEMDARGEHAPERLWGVADEPRPLAVQIWDNDPGTLSAVGERLARVHLQHAASANHLGGRQAHAAKTTQYAAISIVRKTG
ncbi:MAG: tRNA-dihydrouridine synthase, partial [Planctomycetota bacterium]|nr:tRNA-dihydrouridine synthase [Planctomycetota bacterium]